MQERLKKLFAGISLLAATILWGGGFVAVKDSLEILPPIYLIAIRFIAAAIFLSIVFFRNIIRVRRGIIKRGFVLALFLFMAYVFQTIGLLSTTAGKNAFLTTVYVILVPIIAWAFSKRNPGVHVFIAALIAIAGIGLLSLNDDFYMGIGDGLTIVCGFWFALHMVFIARFTQDSGDDPIALTILQMFFCSVFAWIMAPFYDGAFDFSSLLTKQALFPMAYLIVFSSGVAFLLQNVGQKYTSPGTAALLLSLESVFGAFFSALLLDESLNPRMIAGCSLLLFAIVLSETKFSFIRNIKNIRNIKFRKKIKL
ncbi:MAG: DMT family transporter [Spirochaetaceae bacterium]|jgi:drug/metabolite transporter (DMT)-like permease|nr:DMT family transporter [Spirochaetaceae bacterium]GMO22134.1 MAG: DMT family transporter [Termitinemataceae bacterium]